MMKEEFDMTKKNIDNSNDGIQNPTDRVNEESKSPDQPVIGFGGPFEVTEQTVNHSQEENDNTEQTVNHSVEENDNTEQPIAPKKEPIFKLHTELFFGEEKDVVVQRIITANGDIQANTAGDLFDKLTESFGKAGEHLVNETYLKIIEKIYTPQELYDNMFDSLKEIKQKEYSVEILEEKMRTEIHEEIIFRIPNLSEFHRLEEE